mgnify:CR=1 FL=1
MEQIYTIEVNEAFEASERDAACGCPTCTLYNKLEENELEIILGASMHNYRITHAAQSLTVSGRTDDGTIEALEYGDQLLGVQFHPEADSRNDELFQVVL